MDYANPGLRADMLVSEHRPLFHNAMEAVKAAIRSQEPPRVVSLKVSVAIQPVADVVATIASCSKACSHCCKQAVAITEVEADRICDKTGLTRAKVDFPDGESMLAALLKAQSDYANKPCPFLQDDLCSIYAVRPLVCRTHFSLGDPDRCNIGKYPDTTVPYFNLKHYESINAAYALENNIRIADIRAFFPPEA